MAKGAAWRGTAWWPGTGMASGTEEGMGLHMTKQGDGLQQAEQDKAGEQAQEQERRTSRTATEAGWHVSRYNLSAKVPGTEMLAIANLYKGTCAEYTPIELYLMSVLDQIDEKHPIIERLSRRGVIANFDERAALEMMGRASCAAPRGIALTICPTMGCNFDCPYCFENHFAGKMSPEVQDDVVALAERMLDASNTKVLQVTWFGGEPLMAPDVVGGLSKRLIALVEEREGKYNADIITNGYLLTQENVAMLEAVRVSSAQVTIDGIGAVHDATRHLAGGGPTFDRIIENLRRPIPFNVNIRHNVHEGNRDQLGELEEFVSRLAKESGNDINCYPAAVSSSDVADERGEQVGILCGGSDSEIGIKQDAGRFSTGRGSYCGAHNIWSVGIDEKGNLQKCWEAVDKPEISFGIAHDWDPLNPLATASKPDNLTKYLNTAAPVPDEECRECVWLASCVGGCPHKRLFEKRRCVPYKDDPESYVLALHARIGEKKEKEPDEGE